VTPLLKRIARERRTIVVPLAIAILANVAAYLLIVRPLAARYANGEARAEAAARARQSAEAELASARGLVTGKARADEELNAFYKKVLPATQSAANRMTYASLPALARQTNVRYEARTSSVDVVDDSDLGHLQIRMVLQGTYDRIRDFIYQLESAPEFVIIDEVVLAEGDTATLALTLNLSTYFRAVKPDGP
jgi:hypothetical protein